MQPDAATRAGLVDGGQTRLMGLELFARGPDYGQGRAAGSQTTDGVTTQLQTLIGLTAQGQPDLAPSHGQIDLGQEIGIQEGAMEVTAGIVDRQ